MTSAYTQRGSPFARALLTLAPGDKVQITRSVAGSSAATARGDFESSWVKGLYDAVVDAVTPTTIVVEGRRYDRRTGVYWAGPRSAIRPHPGTSDDLATAIGAISALRVVGLDGRVAIAGGMTPARAARIQEAARALQRELQGDTDKMEYVPVKGRKKAPPAAVEPVEPVVPTDRKKKQPSWPLIEAPVAAAPVVEVDDPGAPQVGDVWRERRNSVRSAPDLRHVVVRRVFPHLGQFYGTFEYQGRKGPRTQKNAWLMQYFELIERPQGTPWPQVQGPGAQ